MTYKSYLMVSGDNQKYLNKINDLKCDIAIVNLEDGVFDKNYARKLVYNHFKMYKSNKKIVVRINSLDSFGKDDIEVINKIKPYAIRVPKIQNIDDVKLALKLIHADTKVHLSIESAQALKNLNTFRIDKRITCVYLGILDMLESMGLPQHLLKLDNQSIDYILSKFLIDAKTANLDPISFVYQDYKNTNEFKAWCKKLKNMGFTSKVCISPTQVEIVNSVFKTNNLEIKKSKYIKEIFELNISNGISGFSDSKYGFIDEPIYKNALLILKNA